MMTIIWGVPDSGGDPAGIGWPVLRSTAAVAP